MTVKDVTLNWQKIVLYVTSIGMEGCWLYVIVNLLSVKVAEGRISAAGFMLFLVVAFLYNRLLGTLKWHRLLLRTISWLTWVIAMLLMLKIQLFSDVPLSDTVWLMSLPRAMAEILYVFKPELLILIASAVFWWLGRRMAYVQMSFSTSVTEFQFGLVMLVLFFLVSSQFEVDLSLSIPVAMVFFFFALLGMSLAHAREGSSWLSGLYQGHWSVLLLLSIGLILVLGMLVAVVINHDLIQWMLTGLKWLWGMIERFILWLASLFPPPEASGELPPPMSTPGGGASEEFKMWTMPEALRRGLNIGWAVLFGSMVLFALWRISTGIFGWFRRRLSMAGAEVESLPGAWREDLLRFLRSILFKLLGIKLPLRWRRKAEANVLEIASIRQLYRRLLHWAADGGYPRSVSQTPDEYLGTLVNLLSESGDDLNRLTRYYVSARYGAVVLSDDEAAEGRRGWDRIRQNRLKKPDGGHSRE